jgi:Peptidase family S49 N-terminal/Peptidase family S49
MSIMRELVFYAFLTSTALVNGFTAHNLVSTIGYSRNDVARPHPKAMQSFRIKPLALSPLVVEPLLAVSNTPSPGESLDPVLTYFLQTLISNGVPALFSIIVFAFLAWQLRSVSSNNENQRSRNTSPLALLYDDLYGDQDQDPFNKKGNGFFSRRSLRGPYELPKNTGVPKLQYIQVTHLNPKYDSYQYSITAKTQSKAAAAQQYRQSAWERAWGKAIAAESLTSHQLQSLQKAEQEFLQEALRKQQDIQAVTAALQRNAVDESMKKQLGMTSVYQLDPPAESSSNQTAIVESNIPQFDWNSQKKKASTSTLASLQVDLMQMELKFLQKILGIVGPTHAAALRTALLGQDGEGLATSLLASRPLSRLLVGSENSSSQKKNVYIIRFPGDLNASQVANLREEITAILQSAPRTGIDEVVLILQTGGGTVTGYGLAAAQLQRIKKAQLRLTIAVEQVAASGGYMMACIADHIVASPFAVLGSIGVISDIPNVYERLKNEGIEFQTVTAGK